MKIFVICSKKFYERVPEIVSALEKLSHEVVLPNSFDDVGREERYKQLSMLNGSQK